MVIEEVRADEIAVARRADGQFQNQFALCLEDTVIDVAQELAVKEHAPTLLGLGQAEFPFGGNRLIEDIGRRSRNV